MYERPVFTTGGWGDRQETVRESACQILVQLGKMAPPPPKAARVANIASQSVTQLAQLLKSVAAATMGSAPAHLDTYDLRRDTAREIGAELDRRGGMALMKRVLDEEVGSIPGQRAIDQFWNGIGDWRG